MVQPLPAPTDWDAVLQLRADNVPFVPPLESLDDTQNFDEFPEPLQEQQRNLTAAESAKFAVFDDLFKATNAEG